MSDQIYTLRMHLWFETADGEMAFGLGRVLLLKKVRELGSLNRAAQDLNMSYRAAWGKIRATEEMLGRSLLVKVEGKRGFILSEFSERLLAAYDRFQQKVESCANKEAAALFPWEVRPYPGFEPD